MSAADREQEIFCAALDRSRDTERGAFLAEACGETPAMRGRIEALLRAANDAGGFLAEEQAGRQESVGTRIGRYRLVERIGEGGFGAVYRAEQEEPVRRTVALKIIKLGMDTRAVVARFEAERQALAMMEHPNIARVLDGGATETGRPYFAMELVRGVPIATYCDERRLPLRERLELFLQVCRAVHHAHQKGVIHRDLKPSNILIASDDDGAPVAKVIDFGIAKATREPLTDKTLATRLYAFVGTPAYMSPEQVGLGDIDVDTRSDIYSLGAVLYELLADAAVLDAKWLRSAGYAEVQRAIQRDEPPAPSQRVAALEVEARVRAAANRRIVPAKLVAELRGDLDRIVLKCLEKDRARRYETTDDLGRDITRYLRNEPVLARPATAGYRAAKFARRHRRGVIVGGATLALVASLGILHAHQLATERDRAQLEARKAAKVSELLTELLTASDPFRTPAPQGTLETSAARARQEFSGQPEMRVEILNAIGRAHLRRGEHAKALPILTEALAAGRQIGRPDARLAQTLSDLGILHRERTEFARARDLLEEALQLRRGLFENNHNDVAISLVELGRLYSMLEQLDRAEPLFREALVMRRRVLGEEHREVATSLGDLGMLLWQKGEFAESEPLLVASLELHRKMLGSEHPNYGQALANLALLRAERDDLAGADRLLGESLEIFRRAMGEANWRTARVMGQIGNVWRSQGRLREAAQMLDQAMEIAAANLGPEHTLVASMRVERARVHLAQHDPAMAERSLREALRVQQRAYAEGSWRIASTKSVLGGALLEQGLLDEAETLLREASAALPEIPGPQGREAKPNAERLAALATVRSRLKTGQ